MFRRRRRWRCFLEGRGHKEFKLSLATAKSEDPVNLQVEVPRGGQACASGIQGMRQPTWAHGIIRATLTPGHERQTGKVSRVRADQRRPSESQFPRVYRKMRVKKEDGKCSQRARSRTWRIGFPASQGGRETDRGCSHYPAGCGQATLTLPTAGFHWGPFSGRSFQQR